MQGAAQTGANSCHRPGLSKRSHWSLAGPYQEGDTVTPSWGGGMQRPREGAPAGTLGPVAGHTPEQAL